MVLIIGELRDTLTELRETRMIKSGSPGITIDPLKRHEEIKVHLRGNLMVQRVAEVIKGDLSNPSTSADPNHFQKAEFFKMVIMQLHDCKPLRI